MIHARRNDGDETFESIAGHITTPTAGKLETSAAGGIVNLNEGDTVELWVYKMSAGNGIVLTTQACALYLFKIIQ